jgi:hypothetical protein
MGNSKNYIILLFKKSKNFGRLPGTAITKSNFGSFLAETTLVKGTSTCQVQGDVLARKLPKFLSSDFATALGLPGTAIAKSNFRSFCQVVHFAR